MELGGSTNLHQRCSYSGRKMQAVQSSSSSSLSLETESDLDEPPETSPVIIPTMIRKVTCNFFTLDECCEKHPNPPPKVRVAKSPGEHLFLNRALDFLSNIKTEQDSSHASPPKSNCSREWVTSSGSVARSYKESLSKPASSVSSVDLCDVPSYIQDCALKDYLNKEFLERHPQLQPRLTLSKIVNLREELILKFCKDMNLEACTVALAWNCFHRLLAKNLVVKQNRKLYSAACLLLAFKFMEETHSEDSKARMRYLIKALYRLDKKRIIEAKDILRAEFKVYSYLDFCLFVNIEDYQSDFLHTLDRIGNTPVKYLGEVAFEGSGLLLPYKYYSC